MQGVPHEAAAGGSGAEGAVTFASRVRDLQPQVAARGRRRERQQRARLVRLYGKRRLPVKKVAQELGCSVGHLYRLLDRYGIRTRQDGGPIR